MGQKEQKQAKQSDDIFEKKVHYNINKYITTNSKNLINKNTLIKNTQKVQIVDHAIIMQKVILRSDLSQIIIGKYVILCQNVIIKPPLKRQSNLLKFVPVDICNFVFIDKNTIVQALKIGNYSKIGKDCIIGPRVAIGQCSIILDGSIVTADTQISSFSVYGGKPALFLGQLPQSTPIIQKQLCTKYFQNFVFDAPVNQKQKQKQTKKKQQALHKKISQK